MLFYDKKIMVGTAVVIAIILLLDAVLLSYGAEYTLSRVYTRFNYDYPFFGHIVSFVFGLLNGHWFIGVKESQQKALPNEPDSGKVGQ